MLNSPPSIPPTERFTPGVVDSSVERGLRWTTIRQVDTSLAGTVGVLFYARFLTPDALGAASLALLVYEGMYLLIRVPIGHAVIYYQEDEHQHASAAFWLLMGFSLTAIVLVVLFAPWMGQFYKSQLAGPLTQAVTLAFLFTSLAAVPNALLIKHMRFPASESLLTTFYLIQMIGWIVMSVLGYGAWSLIVPAIIAAAVWAVGAWIVTRFRPMLHPGRHAFTDILRFSRNLWGSELLTYLMNKMDNAAVGTLGERSLGLYAFGEDQASFAILGVAGVIAGVTLPLLAKLQDSLDAFRAQYLSMLRLTAALTFPMQIGGIVIADIGLTLMYGSQWAEAVPIFQAYVCYHLFDALTVLSDAAMSAQGRPDLRLRMNLIQLPFFVAGTWFGLAVWGGIFGVAASLAIVRAIAACIYLLITWRLLKVTPRQVMGALLPSLIAATVMGVAAWAVRGVVQGMPITVLVIVVGTAVLIYWALLWLIDRAAFIDVVRLSVQVMLTEGPRQRIAGIMRRIPLVRRLEPIFFTAEGI